MGQFYYRPRSVIEGDKIIFSFGFKHSPCIDPEFEVDRILGFMEKNCHFPANFTAKPNSLSWTGNPRGLLFSIVSLYHDLNDTECVKENKRILDLEEIKLQTMLGRERRVIDLGLEDIFVPVSEHLTYLHLLSSPNPKTSYMVENAVKNHVSSDGVRGRKWIDDLGRAVIVGAKYISPASN